MKVGAHAAFGNKICGITWNLLRLSAILNSLSRDSPTEKTAAGGSELGALYVVKSCVPRGILM